jgi:hypothetical protein
MVCVCVCVCVCVFCCFNLQFLLLTLSMFVWSTRTTTHPSRAAAPINVIRHFSVSAYCTRSKLSPYRQVCEVALAGSARVLHGIRNLRCFAQLLAPLTGGSEAATQLRLVRGWRQNNYATVTFETAVQWHSLWSLMWRISQWEKWRNSWQLAHFASTGCDRIMWYTKRNLSGNSNGTVRYNPQYTMPAMLAHTSRLSQTF